MKNSNKPKLLLHSCCAGCNAYVMQLLARDFAVTSYFYNPNVHPDKEYEKRGDELKEYCFKKEAPFIEGPYEKEKWIKETKGLENEPERGPRCLVCYKMRLAKTAEFASQNGFDYFATTLSVSPHKLADKINEFGRDLATIYNVKFYEADFKKDDGFKKSCEISKAENFYRQDYCGCIYSRNSNFEIRNTKQNSK